ncbi:MAG: hypothetical protein EON60_05225 [Alphaproteobacteria bacterium]|nr:MAG: hypothetical protein EON60_05225 [Alphaproteobacteria bacterium]
MNRNVFTYFLILMMLVATGSALYSARQSAQAVQAMTSVRDTLYQMKAVQMVGDIILGDRYYKAEEALCGEQATAMCQLVTGKSYDNLGRHNDIWVGLDAPAVLAKAGNLTDEQRQKLTRYTVDLIVALNEQGAWRTAQVGNTLPDRVNTGELYKATVALAMACQRLPDVLDCRKGLPVPVTTALRNLIGYAAEQGPVVDPYSANIRSAGVKAVLDVL